MATEPSQACMCTPSIVLQGYNAKGVYQQTSDQKIYVTGPPNAKSAIIFIYDAFGYSNQVLIAADLLSELTGCLVIMPDVLEEAAIPLAYANLPALPEDKKKDLLAAFMNKVDGFSDIPWQVAGRLKDWEETWPSIQKWGILGLCFGGKVAALASRQGTTFIVSGQAHPSYLAPEDPKLISIPHICLASKGENASAIENYRTTLNDKCHVETYGQNIHGWMGAKANLQDASDKAAFEKGYHQIANFFAKYLGEK
ncbi:hypothetical protein ABW20_dc0102145 [Dactylellina cionopaga]|nr:hypothetical protein ABW20_dc0102145 [Dactylellina cionopaga]